MITLEVTQKASFINMLLDGAIKGYKEYSILPSLTLAQAILESNWGNSCSGNNLFGVKWTEGCGWEKQYILTTEYINGKPVKVEDYFRKYPSLIASLIDHTMFLVVNERYSKVLECNSYIEACNEIQKAGYATDPNYSTQLIAIIEQYKLNEWDGEQYKMPKFTDVKEAIDFLVKQGVITSPDYWLKVVDTTNHEGQLMLNMANKLSGNL